MNSVHCYCLLVTNCYFVHLGSNKHKNRKKIVSSDSSYRVSESQKGEEEFTYELKESSKEPSSQGTIAKFLAEEDSPPVEIRPTPKSK